ncbi:hypothetical protein H4R19_002357 [Coemansia spiralis]|nr:hypothetical protein H4R19_002357 [Coemansia spiralis]
MALREAPQRQPARRRTVGIEERRRQNRVAAARHRQRQLDRLDSLERQEAVLRQEAEELQEELDAVRSSRSGAPRPPPDQFATAIVEMLETVESLRSSLVKCLDASALVVQEIQHLSEAEAETPDQGHQPAP